MNEKTAIFCLDGLNKFQFEQALRRMPKLRAFLNDGFISELNSAPLSEPQAIWAEILTGEPWHSNGCAGYASPHRTLNDLRIFTERDLAKPLRLLSPPERERLHIAINVPLIEPNQEQRIWLASAGFPHVDSVSPKQLANHPPYQSYKSSPVLSMADAMAKVESSVVKFLEVERNRLECAVSACANSNWQTFVYRLSVFDNLAHLLGPDFLNDAQLKFATAIDSLVAELEQVICDVLSKAENCLIFSGFSHIHCRGIFGLDDFLESKKLLRRTTLQSNDVHRRRDAFAALRSSGGAAAAQPSDPLVSKTVQYALESTTCASPVRGAIFINSERFSQSTVAEAELDAVHTQVFSILKSEISKFGEEAYVFENVEINKNLRSPNFIVSIKGIEFAETLPQIKAEHDLPMTTHNSNGFVWCRERSSVVLRPIDITNLCADD